MNSSSENAVNNTEGIVSPIVTMESASNAVIITRISKVIPYSKKVKVSSGK